MGWRMPSSIWQGERVPYQPTRIGATYSKKAFDTVFNCAREINGMRLGAAYQRAMMTLFHDMMHKEIEVYVDDMIAKS